MSKRDKKKLARGTKLSPEHVWNENLDNVVTDLTTVNVNDTDGMIESQYDTGNSTFRLTWNIPKLTSRWTSANGPNPTTWDLSSLPFVEGQATDPGAPYIIPFVLLPFQQYMSFEGKSPEDTPQLFMTEFSYGFDQRDEPALITDDTCGPGVSPAPSGGAVAPTLTYSQYARINNTFVSIEDDNGVYFANGNQGKLHYDIANRGSLKFEIMQKESQYFNVSADTLMTDLLYDLEVPTGALVGRDLRFNPAVEGNLNIFMDPYKTYCLAITPPQLHDPDISSGSTRDNLALVNLTISVKFKCKMVTRDASTHFGDEISGQPSEAGGGKTPEGIGITSPAADSTIEADTPDGINRATGIIDQVYRNKLRSGYDVSSNVPFNEHLCQDAGYDIIAVPLWNNQEDNIVTLRHGTLASMPYHDGGFQISPYNITDTDGPMTRAIIPIDYPFTIHHAFLAANVFTANFQLNGNSNIIGGHPNQHWMAKDGWDQGNAQFPKPCVGLPLFVQDCQPFSTIGLGVGTGRRGTQYGYRQVLYYTDLRLNDDTVTSYLMDKIRVDYPALKTFKDVPSTSGGNPVEPSWRIYNLPLNGIAGGGAGTSDGFYNTIGTKAGSGAAQNIAQDPPHFCGQSMLYRDYDNVPAANPITMAAQAGTSNRFSGTAAGVKEMGEDQWLEVRWKTVLKAADGTPFQWTQAGEYSHAGPAGPGVAAEASDSKIIHGVGGHWLYLIVKKHVVSNANWQKTFLEGGIK